MKEALKDRIMKPAAMIAVYLSIYPAVTAGRVALFNSQKGIFDFILSLFFLLSGYIIANFIMSNNEITFFKKADEFGNKLLTANIFKKSRGKAMRMLLAYCGLILPFLTTVIIYSGGWRALYEAFFAVVFYFIGTRAGMTDIPAILSGSKISFGIFSLAMTLYLSSKFPVISGVKQLAYIFGYTAMFITMLLKSQANLDYNLFARKGLDAQGTAVNMRRYNTGMSVVIFIIVLLALNLKNIVAYLLGFSRDVISAIIALFLVLTTIFFPASEGETPPVQNEQTTMLLPPTDDGGLVRVILNIVLYIVTSAIIIFILYKLFKLVPGKLKELYKKVAEAIRKRIGLLFSSIENSDEYSDEIEVIRPDEGTTVTTSTKATGRKLKQNISKIKDPVQKVRFTYRLSVSELKKQKVEILSSDTAGEIYDKSRNVSGIESELKNITAVYEGVRYADRVPDEKMLAELEVNYNDFKNKLNRKKDDK